MHHLLLLEIKQFGLVTKLGKRKQASKPGLQNSGGEVSGKNSSGISEPDVRARFECVLFNGLCGRLRRGPFILHLA